MHARTWRFFRRHHVRVRRFFRCVGVDVDRRVAYDCWYGTYENTNELINQFRTCFCCWHCVHMKLVVLADNRLSFSIG